MWTVELKRHSVDVDRRNYLVAGGRFELNVGRSALLRVKEDRLGGYRRTTFQLGPSQAWVSRAPVDL